MRYILVLSLLIGWISLSVNAQVLPHNHVSEDYQTHYQYTKTTNASFDKIELQNEQSDLWEEEIRSLLISNNPQLALQDIDIELAHYNESRLAAHYTFQVYYNATRIYNNTIKVNVSRKGVVYAIFDNTDDLSTLNEDMILPDADELLNAYALDHPVYELSNVEIVLFKDGLKKDLEYCLQFDQIKEGTHLNETVIYSSDFRVLYVKDNNTYFQVVDSVAQAFVFNPDPLTTAGVDYGGDYVDDNDNDVEVLNNEIVEVTIPVTYNLGFFFLESEFCIIKELEGPATQIASTIDPVFQYTRSEEGFEDVNCYYHLTYYKTYLESIGYPDLVDYKIEVDAHGVNGADNSFFNSNFPTPRLVFGEGGVDDGEDADVIIHEYGHAISFSAAPSTNDGFERQAMDEALGDYLAVSYGRTLNDHNWGNVFSWDGHNPFWAGRNAASDKHYPENLSSSFHSSGEIWSSSLMEIWEELGRTLTDQMVLEMHYNFAQNLTMPNAAQLFLTVDELMNDGEHQDFIWSVFYNRGLVPFEANAGDDVEICTGESVQIGFPYEIDIAGFDIFWQPNLALDDPQSLSPTLTSNISNDYVLTITDPDGTVFSDTVSVSVLECVGIDEFETGGLSLLNQYAFNTNNESLFLNCTKRSWTDNNSRLAVFDINGSLIHDQQLLLQHGSNRLDFQLPEKGIYLITIEQQDRKATFKLNRF